MTAEIGANSQQASTADVKPKALHVQAYNHIFDLMLHGTLAQGEFIDRPAIAAALGMSLAPVHTAITQLEVDGLVKTRPRKGSTVSVIHADDLAGHLLVREALECQAAQQYIGQIINAAADELRVLAAYVDDNAGNPIERFKADIAFHCNLVDLIGNRIFSRHFRHTMRLGMFMAVHHAREFEDEPDHHRNFIEDLLLADIPEAMDRIRAHLRNNKGNIFS